MAMAILIDCFIETFSFDRYLAMAKDSYLKNYLEDHSLSSAKAFLSIELKTFQSSVSNFFAFELYYSLFHILIIKSSYWVDRSLFNFF